MAIERATWEFLNKSSGNDYRASESARTYRIWACESWQRHNAEKRTEIRSLFLNLKDKGNPALRNEIVLGYIAANKVAIMSKEVGLYQFLLLVE